MKVYLLFLVLVSSFSVSVQCADNELIKAIKEFDIHTIEDELSKGTTITLSQKNQLIQELYATIQQSKEKELSWRKYLNGNTLIGSISLCLCLACMFAVRAVRDKAIRRSNSFEGKSPRENDDNQENTLSAFWDQGFAKGYLQGFEKGFKNGIGAGSLITAFGLVAIHQLYCSLTDQNLKDNYKSTLAMKQLIESIPVTGNS